MYFRMLMLCGQLAIRAVMADCDWTMTSRGFALRSGKTL